MHATWYQRIFALVNKAFSPIFLIDSYMCMYECIYQVTGDSSSDHPIRAIDEHAVDN